MSREALQESLSAVMDNEADELELRRVLAASDDGELRATWARYQVARAVMHKELLEPRLDIAAAVSAALAEEAVPAKAANGSWRTLGRLAVAASVTLAVLAGVRFYNQDELGGAQLAQNAQPGLSLPQMQAQGPAVLAGYSEGESLMPQRPASQLSSANWQQLRLPTYLRQHAQQAAATGADSALPYARAASLENR
ncbi:RNA polymerase subunit sigma [Pseudomonas alcaligenes]|uniref:RNA polymerase subunit sigma n=1 Tax=Aquipseudomonas alcaligenes TaxID=43263 RepID=A0ABR7RX82_AQUAC|nr:RseA family anti-sigma factor [Pseudomonas alcaligenes]MBC9249942.1 RNA polymerase subunit sigma [Pseudomonas alcaligenes]